MKYIFTSIFLFLTASIWGQETSTIDISGQVQEKLSRQAIANAEVELMYFQPKKSTFADSLGNFKLTGIPVGRHRLLVRSENYEDAIFNNLIVSVGKTPVITIYMEEKVITENQIASSKKLNSISIQPDVINTMVDISNQPFTLDEVNHYSGSRSDPARLVTGFAGIINPDDARNDLIVRGATPLGIKWKLEGLDVGNPNHFGYMSTSGGYFPIININMMDNSEFLYGNFSAENGNSTSGTFDINLRKGNTLKTDATAQFSLNGVEAMIEGPFRKGGDASYLVAARYSVLKLFGLLGLDFNSGALPDYFDINFNIHLVDNAKRQSSIFGIYGFSSFLSTVEKSSSGSISINDDNKENNTKIHNGVLGWKHREILSSQTYWQTTLGVVANYNKESDLFYIQEPDSSFYTYTGYDESLLMLKYSLNSFINTKFNTKFSMRAGLGLHYRQFDLAGYANRYDTLGYTLYDFKGGSLLAEAFVQGQYKLNRKLKFTLGLRGQFATINNAWSAEPRFAMIWNPAPRHQIAVGYAWQSSEVPFRVQFQQFANYNSQGQVIDYNTSQQNLDFMRNHYVTLEYTFQIADGWQATLMPYYKYWTSIPVATEKANGFSLVNYASEPLTNEIPPYRMESSGTAQNYGVDLSIKKIFSRGYFVVLNGSWLNSIYQGSDLKSYNSGFNHSYIARLMAGKEFKVGKRKNNALFFSTTFTYAHGGFSTPLDLEASRLVQNEVYSDDWYSKRIPDYLRWDLKFGMRINSRNKKLSHYFYIDAMNVLNRKNIAYYYYDNQAHAEVPTYQVGFVPDILYRIQF